MSGDHDVHGSRSAVRCFTQTWPAYCKLIGLFKAKHGYSQQQAEEYKARTK